MLWRRGSRWVRPATRSIWAAAASPSGSRGRGGRHYERNITNHPRKLAVMGGAYGNPGRARKAASPMPPGWELNAKHSSVMELGCCGHSEEVVAMIRAGFDLFVAGNHEQQAVARSSSCGCGYSSQEDEKISCEAFELATAGLGDGSRDWLSTWPDEKIVKLEGGPILLCHGSPGATSEFLYEAELDDLRLKAWLDLFRRSQACSYLHSLRASFLSDVSGDGRFACRQLRCGWEARSRRRPGGSLCS